VRVCVCVCACVRVCVCVCLSLCMWDMTHSRVGNDSSMLGCYSPLSAGVCVCLCVCVYVCLCVCVHLYVGYNTFTSYVGHDSFTRGKWLMRESFPTYEWVMLDYTSALPIHVWDMTHSYLWHDSFICETWLTHTWDMTHTHMGYDSFIHVTWLIHTCDRHKSPLPVIFVVHLCVA